MVVERCPKCYGKWKKKDKAFDHDAGCPDYPMIVRPWEPDPEQLRAELEAEEEF